MTVGDRVKQLREMHGFTQAALIREVPSLTQSRLSRLEGGLADIDGELIELLAIALEVRSDYFFRGASNSLIGESPQLRARSRLTQSAKSSVLRWAQTIFEEYERLESSRGAQCKLEPLVGVEPGVAASEVRQRLGFDPHLPLPYLILAIERMGVVVLGIPAAQSAMDAFCAWNEGRPLIGLLQGPPPDRVRWSAAHELGHLVLHQGLAKHSAMEREADDFAAELLTPLSGLRDVMPKVPKLSHLTVIKTQWGVSIKSLVRRARELGVIDQDRALSFYKQMSARGWNKSEPGFVLEEKPRGFHKLAEQHYSDPPQVDKMATDAAWSESLTAKILLRHAAKAELPFETRGLSRDGSNVVDLAAARRFQQSRCTSGATDYLQT